ncbi:response regulator [Planktothrix sp. FACHB-1355]|uniref:Response regulator n=1 Tax=Aerosakkonema funiforme FACHB-1375 TaxID=2949571 RepID=A0A926ZH06_9CYAN|nr:MULTISPECIES: response regulator [Oscillatoriales]MBD2181672.1 response regulator [Aerosakkonema funiforme FACHB-1375]MBD3562105.1 response regulator [Planktothrix sp. FACHB-1355]
MMAKKVLIVDDEERLRELVQACLEDLGGWAALTAGSGQEGLQIAQTEAIDAILLDVSMPGMDGFAVYDRLQTNPTTRSIPVILLTAKVLASDRARFAQMGIAGVITKPFDPITITEEVAEILGWKFEY